MTQHPNRTVLLLQQLPLFAGCRRHDLELLGLVADEHEISAGRRLLRAGDAHPRECLLVLRGMVEVSRAGTRIALAGPGDLMGELAMLDGTPRRADAVTLLPTRLLSFDTRGFSQLRSIPVVAERLDALYRQRELGQTGTTLTSFGARTITVRNSRPASDSWTRADASA